MSTINSQRDDGVAVAEGIRRELSLGAGLERFAGGTVPVFAAGDGHVIKLFPETERSHRDTEWAALSRVAGRLPLPTPRPIATGEHGAWSYVVMSRLAGNSLAEAWDAIEPHERSRLMHDVGAALAALHAVPTDGLAPLAIDWPRFMEAQRVSCRDRQLARGLAAAWADAIPDFLARWAPVDDGARALLHTEIMRQHLLVERHDAAWRLSGLLDFEPAVLGAREYEWASVGVFVACAEPGLLRAILEGYGAPVDDRLPYRILAYALLHRYSSLRHYLERLPGPERIGDLEALARHWFTP